jgi:hypothetical protein
MKKMVDVLQLAWRLTLKKADFSPRPFGTCLLGEPQKRG